MWQLMLLRMMIPIVAALAYEIIRYGGRHRNSLLSRTLAQPGLLMQRLTTRQPSDEQLRIAIYALAPWPRGTAAGGLSSRRCR
jgi:uncharacterized protein YqhQ